MKNTRVVALLFGLLCMSATAMRGQQIQVSGANRTIAITTSEYAERRADTAVLHIGYQVYAATSEQVNMEAANLSQAITAALAGVGVEKDAIESENQSTSLVQDNQNNGLAPEEHTRRKFQAQQSWTVRTTADGASKVLAGAVGAGANQSGAIEWSVADEASLSAEAAGKALKHAQAIAEQMASGLGAKLGSLVYASNEAQQIVVLPRAVLNGRISLNTEAASVGMKPLSLSAPVVRRSATVSAVFSIQ
jgi:uncharacterized protein YggE